MFDGGGPVSPRPLELVHFEADRAVSKVETCLSIFFSLRAILALKTFHNIFCQTGAHPNDVNGLIDFWLKVFRLSDIMPKRAANFDGSSQAAKKVLQAGKKYAKQEVFIHNDDKLQKLLRSLVHAAKAFPIEAVGLIVRAVTSGQKVYEQNLSQCFCAIGQVLKSAESLASFVAILDAYVEVKSSIDPEEVLAEDGQMFEAAAVIFCDMLEAGVADMNDKTMQAAMSVFRTQQRNPCLYELLVEKAQEKFPGGVFAPWPPSDNFVVWFGGEPTKDSAALSMMFAKKQMEVWMAKSWSSASTLRLVNGQVVDLLGQPV